MINPPKTDYGYAVFLPENSDEAWLVKAYTVRFNVNGHGEAPDDQHLAAGGKVEKPEDPTASGYAFGGCFKESACQNEWNYDTDTVPDNDNTVLYANGYQTLFPQQSAIIIRPKHPLRRIRQNASQFRKLLQR